MDEEKFFFSIATRADVKVPTASEPKGLGTGNYDAGLVLIGTKTWGKFSFDSNVGYGLSNPAGRFGEGDFFAGQSIRYEVTKIFSLVSEVLLRVPVDVHPSRTTAEFHAGYQWEIAQDLVLDGLIGCGLNSASPDWLATLGVTWTF